MFEESIFKVEKRPVHVMDRNGNYRVMHNQRAIVNTTTDQVLSVMSKDYEPITDNAVLDVFTKMFDEATIEYRPIKHHITTGKDGTIGRQTHMELELPAYTLFPNNPDEIQKCRIVIPNSFDGTTALCFRIMFWRLVCLNGAMGWKDTFTVKIKHRKGGEAKLQDAVSLYLQDGVYQTQQKIEQLANTYGSQEHVMNYLHNNPILVGERWSERLMGHWLRIGTTVNFWNLYNMFTNEITHNYGTNYGSKMNKLELLNSEVDKKWNRVLNVPTQFAVN